MLVSCAAHHKFELQQTAKLGEMSRDDFMNAMRWKQFDVAGSLMVPEHRKHFMKTFAALKDIHIIDVKLTYLLSSEENKRFETTVEMDYYLLPSVTIKTFNFDQTWLYFDEDDSTPEGFFISTPFPDFP
ncbi:MAG: hypothetical protein KAU27_10435 [Desulfuromonadales bacterium]|nr:hypothetical protein [Desulfuromonadales bacterium]